MLQALEVARRHDLSVAVFAQGWTYEVLGMENFFENENKLWGLMNPFLTHHGPNSLPLKTSFCQGFGEKLYNNGKVSMICIFISKYCKKCSVIYTIRIDNI